MILIVMRELSNQLRVQLNQVDLKQSHKFPIKLLVINMYWSQSGIIRYSTGIIKLKTNILSNSNVNKDSKKSSNIKYDNFNIPVKVKITV
jgi:hypothetical protein